MKLKPLHRIPQRNWGKGDCGIACVAMVAGVSYEKALGVFKAMRGTGNPGRYHTFHVDIQLMLSRLGLGSKRMRFKRMRDISAHAIVKINRTRRNGWHWVVFDAGRQCATIHDPKPGKNYLITDFRGLKGSGTYICINHGRGGD